MSEPQTPLPAKLLVSFIFGIDEKEEEKEE